MDKKTLIKKTTSLLYQFLLNSQYLIKYKQTKVFKTKIAMQYAPLYYRE